MTNFKQRHSPTSYPRSIPSCPRRWCSPPLSPLTPSENVIFNIVIPLTYPIGILIIDSWRENTQQHELSLFFLSLLGWIFIFDTCATRSRSLSFSRTSPATTRNICFTLMSYFAEHSKNSHLLRLDRYRRTYYCDTPRPGTRRSTLLPTSTMPAWSTTYTALPRSWSRSGAPSSRRF
jgi:hypothetical protein